VERLRLVATATRWFSDTPDAPGSMSWGNPLPRIVTLCRFRHPASGLRFGVAGVHWDGASAVSRLRSAEALLGWLRDGLPWVVLGDLNATPDDPSVAALLQAGLKDALAGLPARGDGAGTHHAWDGARDGTRIDHVLVSRDWAVQASGIAHDRPGGRLPSDHWPVWADLRLDG
jgi:endonuclease/exonuclease/phosphatase family metal-dependent hydrolase